MVLQYILFIFVIIANLILGAIVLMRKYNRLSGWLFGVAILSISMWAIGDMLVLGARSQSLAETGAYLFYIAPLSIPITLWFFSLIFPEEGKLKWGPFLFGSASFLALSAAIVVDIHWFVERIEIREGLNLATPNMPGFLVYAGYLTFFFVLTYFALLKKSLQVRGKAKLQITYTMFGAFLASMPALITNLLLPIVGVRGLIWLGPVFSLLSVYCVMIAMVRHKMFDIRLVVARSLAYVLSLVVLASGYGLVVFVIISRVFQLDVSVPAQIFMSAATAVVAITFSRIKNFFDIATNRIFFRDAYDPQEFIRRLNSTIVSTVELEPLLGQAVDIINGSLKSEFCVFGLRETEHIKQRFIGSRHIDFNKPEVITMLHSVIEQDRIVIVADEVIESDPQLYDIMRSHDIEVIMRLTTSVSQDGAGFIMLGPKKSGNPYDSQDIRVMSIIANELVIAIQNALRFEEIQQFNVTLREGIEQATRKLQRTNEKLKALDETKDEFISMASHQLRTPLTSVKGYLSMVLEGDAGQITDSQHKLLWQAFISSQRMVNLIADLLNVSRLRTGKFVIESTPTNLANLIAEEIDQLRDTAKARELKLVYEKPKDFPTLMLDETKIRQVAMNFMDNAIYYTPPGGEIRVVLKDTPKTVEFTVADSGIGVPKHEQPHLFTKFYRAGNARKARPDGTGLGLFMAKKVVMAQGGSILFHSREGKGSTFGFVLAKAQLSPSVKAPGSQEIVLNPAIPDPKQS